MNRLICDNSSSESYTLWNKLITSANTSRPMLMLKPSVAAAAEHEPLGKLSKLSPNRRKIKCSWNLQRTFIVRWGRTLILKSHYLYSSIITSFTPVECCLPVIWNHCGPFLWGYDTQCRQDLCKKYQTLRSSPVTKPAITNKTTARKYQEIFVALLPIHTKIHKNNESLSLSTTKRTPLIFSRSLSRAAPPPNLTWPPHPPPPTTGPAPQPSNLVSVSLLRFEIQPPRLDSLPPTELVLLSQAQTVIYSKYEATLFHRNPDNYSTKNEETVRVMCCIRARERVWKGSREINVAYVLISIWLLTLWWRQNHKD